MIYPINLNLKNLEVTIIGGGVVAYRKCRKFLEIGKKVKVVSVEFIDEFYEIQDSIEMIKDFYDEKYIQSSFIVVAATNNKELNSKIGIYCKENDKLVNVVDNINLSNYTVPSFFTRGELLISVSTGGKSPSLSAQIKKDLEEKYDDSYEEYINILGECRSKIIKKYDNIEERKNILNHLIKLDLEELKMYMEKNI
jgi:precorrin-2 dehydrogenase/sirohydrochlorin ferrochelatase